MKKEEEEEGKKRHTQRDRERVCLLIRLPQGKGRVFNQGVDRSHAAKDVKGLAAKPAKVRCEIIAVIIVNKRLGRNMFGPCVLGGNHSRSLRA